MPNTKGGKVTPIPASVAVPFSVNYNLGYTTTGGYSPGISLGTPADWFGPLDPMAPTAPREVAGRRMDFPSGYNLNIQPRAYEPVKFEDLRALADAYDVLRLLIETRKDQMVVGSWVIRPKNDRNGKPMISANDPVIADITTFFEMPDKENYWDAWLRMLLEDMLVIDAPALFCKRDRTGKLYALEQVDGATIKRVIDDWGRTPAPPAPAYQQELHGLPAVNYLSTDMVYRPRNLRAHKVYGYSPVEQVLMTINIALRRQVFLLQYYTEGNIPEALIGAPDNWTTKQIEEFQEWFDASLQGNLSARRRLWFVPGGAAKAHIELKQNALTDATDEWLTRICCFAFSVAPTPFIKAVNRATADNAKEQSAAEGLAPNQAWVKQLIDFNIRREWFPNKPCPVEFAWDLEEDTDPNVEMETLTGYVKGAVLSVNEARAKIGEDPVIGGEKPMALTATGWSPLDVDLAAQRQQTLTPPQLQPQLDANGKPIPPTPGSKVPPKLDANGKPIKPKPGANAKPPPGKGIIPDTGNKKAPVAKPPQTAGVGKTAEVPFGQEANKYDEDQPRNDHGEWSNDGSDAHGTTEQPEGHGEGSSGEHPTAIRAQGGKPDVEIQREGKSWVSKSGDALPEHVAGLKIPPAWKDVKVNANPHADLQVTGKDGKGRTTAMYSQRFMDEKASEKFSRVSELENKYNSIRTQNEAAHEGATDASTKDSAAALRLVMETGIRPGSEEDTGAKVKAYGATTLEGRHVVSDENGTRLEFTGKKGVSLSIPVKDEATAKDLVARAATSGANGQLFPATSAAKLLDHTHSMDGGGFKTKDFRTRLGTATAKDMVSKMPTPKNESDYKAAVMSVAKEVSTRLGNTPSVALQSYISPTVFMGWRSKL